MEIILFSILISRHKVKVNEQPRVEYEDCENKNCIRTPLREDFPRGIHVVLFTRNNFILFTVLHKFCP